MATRIYTKTGDDGDTGLFGGARVPKDHLRVEAYGTVDELNALLGWARTSRLPVAVDIVLGRVQSLLFELGAELATQPGKTAGTMGVVPEDITFLERAIDEGEQEVEPLKQFILPGGTPGASALHMARTVCRRAERHVVSLRRDDASVRVETVIFLNRLSDLLFVLARVANAHAGMVEPPWQPRAS